jgi:hypothetical protein
MSGFEGPAKPGEARNPEGKNGHLAGWQRYGDRLQRWLAMPGDEIAALVGDSAARMKLSSIDIACVRQAAAIIGGEEWLEALEKGLDRIEGKPKQTVAHGGDPNNPTPITLDGVFTLAFGTDENDDRISKQIAGPKAEDADVGTP